MITTNRNVIDYIAKKAGNLDYFAITYDNFCFKKKWSKN